MFDKILKMPLLWANNHAKLKTKALQQGWKKESDYFLLVGFEHVFSYWIFQNLLEPFSNTPSGIILIYFSRIFFEFCRYLFFSWHFENLKRNVTVLYEKKITLLTLSWRRPLSYRNKSNQWTGFYIITASLINGLKLVIFTHNDRCVFKTLSKICYGT